jgi:nucleoside-diphosphate-sugar epimerase
MHTRTVLVTGASGFVGSALLTRLVEGAHASKIIAVHRRELPNQIKQKFPARTVHWVKADITRDELTEAVAKIDVVFHLAGYASVRETDAERGLMESINLYGTHRLAVAARAAGVRHFIYASSIAACETAPALPINEANGVPISSYGRSKKAAEGALFLLADNGFQITVLRPTALFGENHLGSIYELARAIHQGRFVIFGDGTNRVNFYYIRDFVDVLLAVQDQPKAHGQTFVAADEPCRLNELVACISTALNCQRSIPHIPIALGYGAATVCDLLAEVSGRTMPLSRRRLRAMTRDVAYSNEKLLHALNVRPGYGVLKGIRRTVRWFRETGRI